MEPIVKGHCEDFHDHSEKEADEQPEGFARQEQGQALDF
jgi:hypothetical protein